LNREGYLRLAGEKFTLDDLENNFVHLTNNAIQKYGENYGKYENGNIWSFNNFENYMKENNSGFDFENIIE